MAVGIIVGFVLAGSAGRYASSGETFLLFLLGVSSSLVGLFLVGCVQHWRAGVDSAEYGQQMLKIARDQLTVSKQSLKSQNTETRTYGGQASDESATGNGFKRRALKAAAHTTSQEPNEHRGHKIFRVGGSYRAVGDVFACHHEAVAAIDRKLDAPAIENNPEMPASMLLGPEPTEANEKQPVPVDQPSEDGGAKAPRSYADAETPVKPIGPDVAIETSRNLADEEVAEETAEETPAKNTDPAAVATEEDPASKIKEEGGKFLYGRMEFSSREAAEKYVRQLGVNPNFRS